MKTFLLFLLLFVMSQNSTALVNDYQLQDPRVRAEKLDSLLAGAPVYDLVSMFITDSGIKYSISSSEKIRNNLYIFFSDTGYQCIYDLQSSHENHWETKRRFVLRENGVVNYEIRFGVDFDGGNLMIDYTVAPGYSLRNFEFDDVYGLNEVFNIFEILENLKSHLHKKETVSPDKNTIIPITFKMGDARISYFIVSPDSQKEVNKIAFIRYDPKRNQVIKLAPLPLTSHSLIHSILLTLTDNAIEYFESMNML